MGQQASVEFTADAEYLKRAENFSLAPMVRSGVLHDLMDTAETRGDERLWREIGWVLVRSFKEDDLSAQVSDHFVDKCPESVFKGFARTSPSTRFTRWRKRRVALGL